MLRNTILIPLVALLLAGCTSMATRLNGTLTPPDGHGYAILSLTAKAFDPDSVTAGVQITDDHGRYVTNQLADMNTDTVFGEQGMSPVEGKLILLTLTPGRYQAAQAWAHWNEPSGMWAQHRYQTFPLAAPFSVAVGETVYLGEIQLDLSLLPEMKLNNTYPRDMGHIHRVWKVPDTQTIHVRLLQTRPVQTITQ